MDKLIKFIDVHIPINHCNFRCHYCYVSAENCRDIDEPKLKYPISRAIAALSQERLGGKCHFNLCGHGETLIPNYVVQFTEGLLRNGHYVFIVTNGTLTRRFREFERLDSELLKRLGFKLSFHYLELKRLNLLDTFVSNFNLIREMGCSVSIEITPNDELVPFIEEIKKFSLEKFGALPHLTVPRDMNTKELKMLTKMTDKEFISIWSVFDSALFDFKISEWEQKRKEFCYAGKWTGLLNLESGLLSKCYGCPSTNDIFKDISRTIEFSPVGNNCQISHCFNGHSFLALGVIPSLLCCSYAEERNRIMIDGSEWLTPEMKSFISQKLYDNNKKLNRIEIIFENLRFRIKQTYFKVKTKITRK